MSNAADRALRLFLQTPKQGVTDVTHVTGRSVTHKSRAVTMVTPVTYIKQKSQENGVTNAQPGELTTPPQRLAGIVDQDRGIPNAWAEALRQLHHPDRPPHGVTPREWRQFHDDAHRFIDRWRRQARALSWRVSDVLGWDPSTPFWLSARYIGLAWHINGGYVIALTMSAASIVHRNQQRLIFERRH